MTSAALQREAFMPRAPRGMGSGLALALGVHVLLVVALAFSVNWRASSPAVAEAELWGAVPQVAAPRAAEPDPPPPKPLPQPVKPPPVERAEPEPPKVPDAQIAIEKAKRDEAKREKLLEQQREAKEKDALAKKAREDERERKADEARAKAREEVIRKILGDAAATGAPSSKGTAQETKTVSASLAGRIRAKVKSNIMYAADTGDSNPVAEVEVRCAPDGKIISQRLVKSSGVKSWDEAVLRAIDKTEMLPLEEGRIPSSLTLVFSLRD